MNGRKSRELKSDWSQSAPQNRAHHIDGAAVCQEWGKSRQISDL